jgi:hypothetical protein
MWGMKDENGDLIADSDNILNRWRNYFCQLVNVNRVSDVKQMEIVTAEQLVSDPSPYKLELLLQKVKKKIKFPVLNKFQQN